MKRIIKFIIFKVMELSIAFLVWWGLSWYGYWVGTFGHGSPPDYDNWIAQWILGPLFLGLIGGIIIPIGIIIIVYYLFFIVLPEWIKWNWQKAGE